MPGAVGQEGDLRIGWDLGMSRLKHTHGDAAQCRVTIDLDPVVNGRAGNADLDIATEHLEVTGDQDKP